MFARGSLVLISCLCEPLISSHFWASPLALPLPTPQREALQMGRLLINPMVASHYTGKPKEKVLWKENKAGH